LHLAWRSSQLEVGEKLSNKAVAGCIPLARAGLHWKVAKAEVQKAMGEDVKPFLGFCTPLGMNMDYTHREC
jgi:hypothetical protein